MKVKIKSPLGKGYNPGAILEIIEECTLGGDRYYDIYNPETGERFLLKDVECEVMEEADISTKIRSLKELIEQKERCLNIIQNKNIKLLEKMEIDIFNNIINYFEGYETIESLDMKLLQSKATILKAFKL